MTESGFRRNDGRFAVHGILSYIGLMNIDHDPDEVPHKPSWFWDAGIYWIVWGMVALLWAHQFYFNTIDWYQIALGFGTGGVLATWAINITGNKIPDSWRGKPPRR